MEAQPSDVAVTPDGEYAYVTSTSQNNSAVSVISTTTNKVTATIKVDGSNGVAITPDGKYAYVTSQFSEPPNIDENFVSVISTVSNKVTAKIPLSGSPTGLALTPNGEFAYVAEGDDDKWKHRLRCSDKHSY